MSEISVDPSVVKNLIGLCQTAQNELETSVVNLRQKVQSLSGSWNDKKFKEFEEIADSCCSALKSPMSLLLTASAKLKEVAEVLDEYESIHFARRTGISQQDRSYGSGRTSSSLSYDTIGAPKTVSDRRFQRQSRFDAEGLSYEQRRAIQDYCSDNGAPAVYQRINSFLRGQSNELPGYLRNEIDSMTETISERTLDRATTVYRGLTDSRPLFEEYADLSAEELNERFVGQTYIDRGFCSTSISEAGASEFAQSRTGTILEIRAPEGAQAIFTGELSSYRDREQEILFQRGSVFTINRVSERNGVRHVDLTLTGRLPL